MIDEGYITFFYIAQLVNIIDDNINYPKIHIQIHLQLSVFN